ncbi:MAG: hypothetical protein GEU71_15900, partial [Actinobacteria bacterium]|nr:hypothetical protein [Actinomycetota bacterium]
MILLFVDFPDATSDEDTHDIAGPLSEGIEEYYEEVSYGQLSVNIDAVHQWYQMPSDSGTYDYGSFDGQWQLFTDATNAADPDVDFSDYDIILTAEGPGETHSYSPAFLGAGKPVMTDEGPIKWGSTLGQDIYSPSRGYIVPVHEMGHLFGLPDLYAYDGDLHRFVGSWDIMGNIDAKPGMSAWHRNKMGWFAAEQVTCIEYSGTTEVDLTPLADP